MTFVVVCMYREKNHVPWPWRASTQGIFLRKKKVTLHHNGVNNQSIYRVEKKKKKCEKEISSMAGELHAAVTPCRLIRAPENSFVLTRKNEAHAVDMSDSWTPAGLSQPCHEPPLLFTFQTTKSCRLAARPVHQPLLSAPVHLKREKITWTETSLTLWAPQCTGSDALVAVISSKSVQVKIDGSHFLAARLSISWLFLLSKSNNANYRVSNLQLMLVVAFGPISHSWPFRVPFFHPRWLQRRDMISLTHTPSIYICARLLVS